MYTSPSMISTAKTGTGSKAGRLRGLPVVSENLDP